MNYYHYIGSTKKIKKVVKHYTPNEYYFHVLLMGLRLTKGLNLKNKLHVNAFNYFKNKIDPNLIMVKNNHVTAKNINQIDEIFISII